MYDYHTHSHFSNDCNSKLEDMVQAAIRKGLRQIAITDHIDLDYLGTDMTFEFDIQAQQDYIENLQKTLGSVIEIKKGIEMGIQPHVLKDCSQLVKRYRPDFVLASMHMAERKDLYNGDFTAGKTALEALTIFFSELEEMVTHYTDYSVVGHFDILKRYDQRMLTLSANTVKTLAEPSFKKIIQMNKGIEINTSGLRQGLEEPLPSRHLLELYYEMGGRIVTMGSDAHMPQDVGHSFEEVAQMLRAIGFKDLYTFKQMEPIPIQL